VKPEVATHEGLFDLEQATKLPIRFAWVMLWTVCDREGRFRWRPRMLKADVLPFDALDFGHVLDALASAGFIQRYESKGEAFGYIPTWHEHQAVNSRESASKLPSPPVVTTDIPLGQRTHAHAREEGEREGERELEREREREGEREAPPAARPLAIVAPPEPPTVEYSPGQIRAAVPGLIGAWNNLVAIRPEFAGKAATMRPDHPKVYGALRDHPSVDWWADLFRRVVQSDVLSGRKPWRDGGLKAVDFFWVLRNADEIAAGAYDNHIAVPKGGKTTTGNRSAADAAKRLLACPTVDA
jgi:hypothetical protein